MIIIKIMILYFIQIRHTDDFSSSLFLEFKQIGPTSIVAW